MSWHAVGMGRLLCQAMLENAARERDLLLVKELQARICNEQQWQNCTEMLPAAVLSCTGSSDPGHHHLWTTGQAVLLVQSYA